MYQQLQQQQQLNQPPYQSQFHQNPDLTNDSNDDVIFGESPGNPTVEKTAIDDDVENVDAAEDSAPNSIGSVIWARLGTYPFRPAIIYPHDDMTGKSNIINVYHCVVQTPKFCFAN